RRTGPGDSRMTDRAITIPPGTEDVLEKHRVDLDALGRYLESHVENFAGPLVVRQFRGGQSNPTYFLGTPARGYVLRRKPPGKLLPSAHAVDREYRGITALAGSGVPVPRTYALCEDPDVIGTPFFVMDFVPGRVFMDNRLPDLSPGERSAIYNEQIEVLARLH